MSKKVFIILVNYNGVTDTLECIKSLESIYYNNYEIVVVDNDSTDNSLDILKEKIGYKHHVISSNKNGGFAFGNNIGIRYALEKGADYVLLINNDTTVEPDFLDELVNSMEKNDECGITTGLILNYYDKNLVWYAGGEINWNRFYGYHKHENKNINRLRLYESEVSFATGCLMLIRSEVITKVGELPEEYFMYYEDVDYCANIQENGYKIYFNPKSIIYHKISATSGESESPFAITWNTRNRVNFINKYRYKISNINYIKLILFFYITRIIKFIKYISKGRLDKARALLHGLRRSSFE